MNEYLPVPEEYEEVPHGTNGEATRVELINAAAFMASELTEPDQVIRGILHQGSKFCIGGASKACKTWALLDLAISVANGIPWLNFPTTQGKVLYINFEIQNFAWQRRIETVATAKNVQYLDNIELLNLRGKPTDFGSLIPQIIESVKDGKFILIVIDPIYKLYGRTDENNARDVAALLTAVERLSHESGAAVAYASHFSKGNQSGKEAMDRVSGSGVFSRDPDSILILTQHAEEDAFTVEGILRNFAPVSSFVVRWKFPLLEYDETLNPEDLKKPGGRPSLNYETDLLDCLAKESLSSTDWYQNSRDQCGVSRATFFRVLKDLESQGLILKSKINQKWCLVSKVS